MEIDGADIWTDVRQRIVDVGPVRVLRRIVKHGHDVEEALESFVGRQDATELLRALGASPPKTGESTEEAALQRLVRLASRSGQWAPQGDEVVLRFFDAWAAMHDNSAAIVAGNVVGALGRELAVLEFDNGCPGSAQQLRAYRFDGSIIVVSDDYGVCGYYGQIKDVLRDWVGFTGGRIYGPAVTHDRLDALRRTLDRTLDEDSTSWQSVSNGRSLTRAESGAAEVRGQEAAEAHERQGDTHASARAYAAALNQWRLAASLGSGSASWKLAALFRRGSGTDRDSLEAARRCRSAAERGHPGAQLRLARASERLLKYRDADLWHKLATEAGVSDRRLNRARANRLAGTKNEALSATISRLSTAASAGQFSEAVTLVALLASNGRSIEARSQWTNVLANSKRLTIDDALVLELSKAREYLNNVESKGEKR